MKADLSVAIEQLVQEAPGPWLEGVCAGLESCPAGATAETTLQGLPGTHNGDLARTDYRHMAVEEDPLITKGLPTEFDSHSVEYLDSQGLVQRYRKLGKSYAILVIRPMQSEGKTLKVAVVLYWVSSKKGHLQLALSDWSDVGFQYDCDKREFVVTSVKLDGI